MGDGSSTEISSNIHWTEKLEDYFISTGEKAHCLGWVHKQSEAMYSNRKTFIDLPVIIGSSMIGFLNAGSQSMFSDARVANISLGVGSLIVGILNTMGTYFGWAKRSEGHRISSIHYAKLYRFISVEMALPREERMSPHDLLKYVKDQYDRLAEISPLVPASILSIFQKRFKKNTDISKPEEATGLEKITVYKRRLGDESATPRDVRIGIDQEIPVFSSINPMRIGRPTLRENFTVSEETLAEVSTSPELPEIPTETIQEAEATTPSS